MDKKTRVLDKIAQIEKLIDEIKRDLTSLGEEQQVLPRKKMGKEEVIPSQEELRNLYEQFYEYFLVNRREEIIKAIEKKTKKFLASFCKANNLPIDGSKASKKKISEEVINWLSQRKAITKEVR
jgi:uncharacterized protein Yka (UPF0111/DUF47 family)